MNPQQFRCKRKTLPVELQTLFFHLYNYSLFIEFDTEIILRIAGFEPAKDVVLPAFETNASTISPYPLLFFLLCYIYIYIKILLYYTLHKSRGK